MLGKRLINTGSAATPTPSCTTDTLNILGDSPNSCIAYYKMSDATDESGSYDGTPTSVNFNVQGKFGNAGSFNGVDTNGSRITIPSLANWTSTGVSASIWVKLNNTPQSGYEYTLISFSGNASFNWGITSSRKLTLSGAGSHTPSTGVIPLNIWTQVAVSITSSQNVTFYINGSASGSYTNSGSSIFAGGGGQNCIGSFKSGTTFYYSPSGELDQIRIFNKSLSSTEVTTIYNEVYCQPTIVPTDNFNPVIYTGNNTATPISTGFAPDLVWIKNRTGAADHHSLIDSVRGKNSQLFSNLVNAENTFTDQLDSFDSNGFTVGTGFIGTEAGRITNVSGVDYVAWNWKAGGADVLNEDGTIDSQVSANVDAGFSIVKHTGTGVVGTVGHGLDSAPELIIYKQTSSSSVGKNWVVYASPLGNTGGLLLNLTGNKFTDTDAWNNTTPTSTVFTLGAGDDGYGTQTNVSGKENIAYCFHSVDGMSRVGSYVGTGASNTIVTGFRPAFLMIKNTTGGSSWVIFDNKRNPSNPKEDALFPNLSSAEYTFSNTGINFLSNGFSLISNPGETNLNNNTYIFLAIAEEVFNPSGVTRNATNPFGDASEKALYKFEDNATDAEGNFSSTTLPNVTFATGYIDKAAVFNGSNAYITLPNSSSIAQQNNFTISFWVKPNGFVTYGTIATFYSDYRNYVDIRTGGVLGFKTTTTQLNTPSGSITDSVWQHIVLTKSSTEGTVIYVDTVSVATDPSDTGNASDFRGSSYPNTLGAFQLTGSVSDFFPGSIDQFRIFNRAIDSGEVLQLYNE